MACSVQGCGNCLLSWPPFVYHLADIVTSGLPGLAFLKRHTAPTLASALPGVLALLSGLPDAFAAALSAALPVLCCYTLLGVRVSLASNDWHVYTSAS